MRCLNYSSVTQAQVLKRPAMPALCLAKTATGLSLHSETANEASGKYPLPLLKSATHSPYLETIGKDNGEMRVKIIAIWCGMNELASGRAKLPPLTPLVKGNCTP